MTLIKSVREIVEETKNPLLSKHPDWERIELGKISDILNGYAFKSKYFTKQENGIPIIRIRDVGNSFTDANYTLNDFDQRYLIKKGELLVGMDGDFRAAFWNGPEALLNQRVCKISLNTDLYSEKFLGYVLQGYLDEIHKNTSAVTVKHLSSIDMQKIPLPLPPFNEQVRIVGRVEELFSQLDAAVRSLQTAQTQLEQYRQTTLQQAYTGKLTQQWRKSQNNYGELEKNALLEERKIQWEKAEKKKILKTKGKIGKYNPPLKIDKIPTTQLPEEWIWESLDFFTYYIIDYRGKTPPNSEEGIPIISAANVKDGLILNDKPRYVSEKTYEKWTTRGLPEEGDLILTTEAPVGEAALYPKNQTFLLTRRVLACQTLMINQEYLLHYFNTKMAQDYITENSRGTTVPRILKPNLLKIPIPTPSFEEQNQIVNKMNHIFSRIKLIERDIEEVQKTSLLLRNSILKKAFEGRLVPQDPRDEPASVLLERIKAQKTKQRKLI